MPINEKKIYRKTLKRQQKRAVRKGRDPNAPGVKRKAQKRAGQRTAFRQGIQSGDIQRPENRLGRNMAFRDFIGQKYDPQRMERRYERRQQGRQQGGGGGQPGPFGGGGGGQGGPNRPFDAPHDPGPNFMGGKGGYDPEKGPVSFGPGGGKGGGPAPASPGPRPGGGPYTGWSGGEFGKGKYLGGIM